MPNGCIKGVETINGVKTMKINIELELEGCNEDYSIDEELRSELSHQIAKKLADIVSKTELKAVDYDTEVKEAKKMLNATVSELRNKRHQDIKDVQDKVTSTFNEFISGTAYRLNKWGEEEEKITVGDYIKDQIAKAIESKEVSLSELIAKKVSDHMSLSTWDIERLIKDESDKARNENAKKVAEFIVKGAL